MVALILSILAGKLVDTGAAVDQMAGEVGNLLHQAQHLHVAPIGIAISEISEVPTWVVMISMFGRPMAQSLDLAPSAPHYPARPVFLFFENLPAIECNIQVTSKVRSL